MKVLTYPVGDIDHLSGAEDAAVTLVEYGDFQCPYCGEMYRVIKEVQAEMGNQLRFVFRHFPLTNLHQHAMHAAQFAEAAATFGKFWQAHDTLFEHQFELDDESLVRYATGLDVPVRDVSLAFEGKYDDIIREDFNGGVKSGVSGTPTLFVNGRRYEGPPEAHTISAALRMAISHA
ncbi:protein-disulfide isomerase [Paraburkholderia sp. GAS199]|uniref:DsbA family protein n=1 Tax=Paraburkholderia sp. GAS199 TaxID=3035126 RepID=UPI003D2199EA